MNASSFQWWYPVVAWGVVAAAVARGALAGLERAGIVRGGRPTAWLRRLPIAAGAMILLPIDGLPLGRWLYGACPTLSIPFVLLLAERVVRPFVGGPLIDARGEWTAVVFALVCGLALYPATLGIGPFDPYVLGWKSPGVAGAAAVVGAVLLVANNRFGLLLLAAGIGWRLGMLESSNAWDALIDPVFFFCAVGYLVGVAGGRRATRPDRWPTAVVLAIATAAAAGETVAGDVAATIRSWEIPESSERCVVVRIAPAVERPAGIESPADDRAWEAFVAARKERAKALYAQAVASAREAAIRKSVGRGCEAMRLMHRVLREDPDHAQARAACGWVRRSGTWVSRRVAARIDEGRTIADARATGTRSDRRGWKVTGEHWEVLSTADEERSVALVDDLERAGMVWRQVFGAFEVPAEEILRRIERAEEPRPEEPCFARLVKDRAEYVAAFESREPAIGRTLGIYWAPTRTSWFVDPPGPTTVLHEATHQLFMERSNATLKAGERCNFWAIEAVACFMESLETAPFGWTLGGRDAGRFPAARRRLVDEGGLVPLADLCRMGRREFQADERLPTIYSQLGGLADFFLLGEDGRRREPFLDYLFLVYADAADPGTLATLCHEPSADLDEAYRRHVAR